LEGKRWLDLDQRGGERNAGAAKRGKNKLKGVKNGVFVLIFTTKKKCKRVGWGEGGLGKVGGEKKRWQPFRKKALRVKRLIIKSRRERKPGG